MLLNTGFSGPQAWLLLAIRRGHVAAAGIELALTPGSGAYNAAPRLLAEGFDLSLGDINAAIELAARGSPAPVGIFASFNASPSCIAVPRDGAIRAPADLAGQRLIGHASDVALRCFGAFRAASGMGEARVQPAEGTMAALAGQVLAGEAAGLFCYASTLSAALAAEGRRIEDAFLLFRYADFLPDFYGTSVMAAPALAQSAPAALRALLAAFSRGMAEAFAEPQAAIEAVLAFAPQADAAVETRRWEATLALEMAHPEGAAGFGGVDPARFARGVAEHARGLGLPVPDPALLFSDAFLPAPALRPRRPA